MACQQTIGTSIHQPLYCLLQSGRWEALQWHSHTKQGSYEVEVSPQNDQKMLVVREFVFRKRPKLVIRKSFSASTRTERRDREGTDRCIFSYDRTSQTVAFQYWRYCVPFHFALSIDLAQITPPLVVRPSMIHTTVRNKRHQQGHSLSSFGFCRVRPRIIRRVKMDTRATCRVRVARTWGFRQVVPRMTPD